MLTKGIDHSTCPAARVVGAICSRQELEFADALRKALDGKKVLVPAGDRLLPPEDHA